MARTIRWRIVGLAECIFPLGEEEREIIGGRNKRISTCSKRNRGNVCGSRTRWKTVKGKEGRTVSSNEKERKRDAEVEQKRNEDSMLLQREKREEADSCSVFE